MQSIVSRALYWQNVNAQAAEQADQQRQQDQAMLLHQDVLPNWDRSQTALATSDLTDQEGSGNSAGSALGSSGSVLPPSFLDAPS